MKTGIDIRGYSNVYITVVFAAVTTTISCSKPSHQNSNINSSDDPFVFATDSDMESTENEIEHTDSDTDSGPLSSQSEVFPYGLKYQLHANSPSLNTPPHGSYLMTPIGNSGAQNRVTIPTVKTATDFSNIVYFDSSAPDGGEGTKTAPYNTLSVIDNLEYPNDCALLLKAGSIFYESRLNSGETQQHIYFGVYGEGDSPIVTNVDDFGSPSTFGWGSSFEGDDITVDGIHFVGASGNTYERLMNVGASNLTIAHCHLESIPHPEGGYLYNILKGGGENMVLYHNEIAFSRDDIWYGSSKGTYQIVSNYFHHANMGTFATDNFDPEDRATWQAKGGDIIQFEYENLNGAYIANNFFDKGDSASKFALIFNGGQSNENVVVEYNTFIAPMNAFGGAALQWHTSGVLYKNLILNTDPEGGVSALASYAAFATEISENHIVGYTEETAFWNLSLSDLAEGNEVFPDLSTYQSDITPDERLGSDIFSHL